MIGNYSTYTPTVIRDLEQENYYETLMCVSCKKTWVEMPLDERCDCDDRARICRVPF
jgi:hypothetical protein